MIEVLRMINVFNYNFQRLIIHKFLRIVTFPYRFFIITPYNFIISTIAYNSLKQEKTQNEVIFILSCTLGDVVFGMAYLKAYKNKNLDKHITLIAEEKTKPIVEAYDSYDEVRYYNKKEKWGKRYLRILNASKFYYDKGLSDEIYNTIPWVKHGFEGGTCLELLRSDLALNSTSNLSLNHTSSEKSEKDEAIIECPHPKHSADVHIIHSIKNFSISKDRIVVINPYGSNNNICQCGKELEEIIKFLHNNGYRVYCNVIPGQDVLRNTLPLRCDLNEFYAIANAIPLIISVRSGIMDWVVNTKSKKIVLDPHGFNSKARSSFYRFYAMSQWKRDNIVEIALPNPDLISIINDFI